MSYPAPNVGPNVMLERLILKIADDDLFCFTMHLNGASFSLSTREKINDLEVVTYKFPDARKQ